MSNFRFCSNKSETIQLFCMLSFKFEVQNKSSRLVILKFKISCRMHKLRRDSKVGCRDRKDFSTFDVRIIDKLDIFKFPICPLLRPPNRRRQIKRVRFQCRNQPHRSILKSTLCFFETDLVMRPSILVFVSRLRPLRHSSCWVLSG